MQLEKSMKITKSRDLPLQQKNSPGPKLTINLKRKERKNLLRSTSFLASRLSPPLTSRKMRRSLNLTPLL